MDNDSNKISNVSLFEEQKAGDNPCLLQVIGVGGCGGSIVEALRKKEIDNISLAVCDSDSMVLGRSKVDTKVLLKRKKFDSSDINDIFEFDEETTEKIANIFDNDSKLLKLKLKLKDKSDANDSFKFDDETKEKVAKLFDKECKFVVLTAGLGGEAGTETTPVIARAARTAGKTTFAIVTIPFLFEGDNRIEKAQNGIEAIRNEVDKIFVLENESIKELIEDSSFTNTFGSIDSVIINLIKSIVKNIKDHILK